MTAQHTPGPWKAARNSAFWEVVKPWPDQTLDEADSYSPSVAHAWGPTEQEAKANANLIAAAPDLLEACIKTVEENLYLADGENCTLIHLVKAIAKATGETT